MPWLRLGDNVATNPIVTRVRSLPKTDRRSVNEVFGFVVRCAAVAASHTTDYAIDEGIAEMIGGPECDRLLDLAVAAGYLKPRRGKARSWVIVDDPDFIHMRTRAEIDWERQQKADNANPVLIVPVRLRDGDACRYCGAVVNWRARKGKLGGTYDHREPRKYATVDTLVVACRGCNAGRKDAADADERYPLKPAPTHPFYSPDTAAFLTRNGRPTDPTPRVRSADQPPRNGGRSADSADPVTAGLGNAGTGRVGTGQVGPGRAGTGSGRTGGSSGGRGHPDDIAMQPNTDRPAHQIGDSA